MSEKLQAVFDREVEENGIILCQGCERFSHRRAYAELKTRIVHILPGVPTRKRLFTGPPRS